MLSLYLRSVGSESEILYTVSDSLLKFEYNLLKELYMYLDIIIGLDSDLLDKLELSNRPFDLDEML